MSKQVQRGLIILSLLLAPFVVGLLFTYQVIRIPFETAMSDSPAVDYQEGPRLSPPEGAVPVQGASFIESELPINPVASDPVSLQRGEILYGLHCELCHGKTGSGDGPLAGYFSRTPTSLTSDRAAAEFDGSVYLAIVRGFGQMPALSENLTVRERWDVVNYIRTLPASGE